MRGLRLPPEPEPLAPPLVGIAPVRYPDAEGRPVLAVRPTYLDAVRLAGGRPVVLGDLDPRAVPDYVARLDALVLPGGRDLHPRFYGSEPEPEAELELLDDDLGAHYLALARAARAAGLPLLGVCLGCQVMNVAAGGTLIQDLPRSGGALDHGAWTGRDVVHAVALEDGSRIRELLGQARVEVASHHHQALDRVGEGLVVSGRSADGVIEAVEVPGAPFSVGVQWHPERTADPNGGRALFSALIHAARERASGRAGAGVVSSPAKS